MKKTVKVTYNADTLQTEIIVDGQPFDTSRINGKEIADWAYPFMMRKIKWNGFYDEMVGALGGEKAFDLVFKGSEEALAELKEAWEDAPVTIIDNEKGDKVVIIEYDADKLSTKITVNGQPFDTSRIEGREIEDWVYPFMMRKVKWDGIFEELAKVVGSEEYSIEFSGSDAAMKELMEECPETVEIIAVKSEKSCNTHTKEFQEQLDKYCDQLLYKTLSYDEKKTIFAWFWKNRNLENDTIWAMIGRCYSNGDGVEKDEEKAKEWYTRAAERNNPIAQNGLGCYEADDKKAVKWFLKAAEQGFSRAQCNLGNYYYNGKGVEQNYAEAVKWYRKAAEQGNADAQDDLGDCYYFGNGVEQNYVEAVKWYRKAAEQGNADAQDDLGDCYCFGEGVEQNYAEAVKWYRKAAEQGNAYAQASLGDCYYLGDGVKKNYKEAVKWYRKAAEQGSADAQASLGICYHYGEGVDIDYKEAVKLLTKSVDQGCTIAYGGLADCYRYGHGVNKDKEKAKELYRKGIELGDQYSKESYEDMLKNGERIKTAKKVGSGILEFLGAVGGAYAQGYAQAAQYNDNDDDEY